LSGFLCVTIGAFAAHGLSKVLDPKELAWIETGVKYQMFHTLAIMGIGIAQLCRESLVANKMANVAAGSWALGVLLFSGSLYALALGAGKFLVWVTPVGGTLFLIGWFCLAYGSLKK
jgi:membrane protein